MNIKNAKLLAAASLAAVMFMGNAGLALAQTSTASTTDPVVSQIQALLQKVRALQDQLSALDGQKSQLKDEMRQALQLTRTLSLGMTGDEVKLLQEMLATDPEIYPEGLVTGYFGSLTQKAVRKFQAKFGIEQAGNVGPKTLGKINELLTEGAGNSGKIPPGLLRAPGIAKKLNGANSTTTLPETGSPTISNIFAVNTASTTAYIYWTTNEKATSTLWYGTTTPVNTTTATKVTNNSWKTVHSAILSGLKATTTYYYKIEVRDTDGNATTTNERSFTTSN